MKTPLWVPSEERKRQANITRFMEQVNARSSIEIEFLCRALSVVR